MSLASRCAALCGVMLITATATAFAANPPNQVDASFLAGKHVWMDALPPNVKAFGPGLQASGPNPQASGANPQAFGPGQKGFGPSVPNIDTLVNFQGSFKSVGVDGNGNPASVWPYAMVGNAPTAGGVTLIDTRLIPVSIQMLDANGRQAYANGRKLYMDSTQYTGKWLRSPIFSPTWFSSSSVPTQYTDAVFRAEFWSVMRQDWHTIMVPRVERPRVMSLPYGSYEYALNADGSCCQFVLVNENVFLALLFPPTYPVDNTTIIGAAELDGDMTTKTLAAFLFPNTYLFENNDPNQCCVLGFHEFDSEPGIPANGNRPRAYTMAYASWITPGLFGPSFEDVTALSHELAETFNDPLVLAYSASGGPCGAVGQPLCLNTTPWWLSPNGNCQDNLEVGDVIEGLSDATSPMRLNGYTFHPQNVALLQYFEQGGYSNPPALEGAFSYPDPSVLAAGPSVPQQVGCAAPLE
jgi:hypothetical protein